MYTSMTAGLRTISVRANSRPSSLRNVRVIFSFFTCRQHVVSHMTREVQHVPTSTCARRQHGKCGCTTLIEHLALMTYTVRNIVLCLLFLALQRFSSVLQHFLELLSLLLFSLVAQLQQIHTCTSPGTCTLRVTHILCGQNRMFHVAIATAVAGDVTTSGASAPGSTSSC